MTTVNLWARLRSAVRAAQAAIRSQPGPLAPLVPLAEDALEILNQPASPEAIGELEYLLKQIQDFAAKWRPSPTPTPGVVYIQPGWARSTDEQAGVALSILSELRSIEMSSQPANDTGVGQTMRVFISHSSADRQAAEAFVEFVRAALNIASADIRCTSVDGYRLPAGAASNEQLRSEVFGCDVFIALLSPASMKSVYVMFELGARWGANRYMAPVLIGGLTANDLKAPLNAIQAINGDSEADLHQLVEDMAKRLGAQRELPAAYGRALRELVRVAAPSS